MTYVIGAACIDVLDRGCVDICPAECIHEAGRMLVIDPYTCIDCGVCEPVCPVAAIAPLSGLPASEREFIEINAAYAFDTSAVDELVERYLRSRLDGSLGG